MKDYGRKKIGPLDLKIDKGEIVGFLGPNGSGKTTSLRMILGLIKASSGSVRINGFDPISKHIRALKNVGYSPELPNIQAFLSPQELLTLIARELEISKSSIDQEISRVLELVGLLEYRRVKVGKMSKGMVQRLSIAQGIIGSPEVLILDEPMIGLDPAGTAHLREVFRQFSRKGGGTVFLSSHMMNEVESLCDRIFMIHNGKIILSGTIEEVTRKVLGFSAITVEAEGVSDDCLGMMKGLRGVREIRRSGGRLIQIEIVEGSEDLRPKISELIVQSRAKLYTIKPSDDMLERAYIEALSEGSTK